VSTESEEVAPGIVLDFDERNQVIGFEIEDVDYQVSDEDKRLNRMFYRS